MISHGKEIKVFTGNSNPALAEHICSELYKNLGNANVTQFADGECSVSVFEPAPFLSPSAARTCSSSSPPATMSTTT